MATTTWTTVNSYEAPEYANVDTEQNPGYSAVNPAQEPVWQQIET